MSLPRRDIVPVDPAQNVAEEEQPSRPGAQNQPPQASMDGSQLVQLLSAQAGNMAGDLQQYDGQLRSHVHALQDECREHVGQEEDKMRKELQHALTQESSVCHDQLQQALKHQVCQEEYADAAAHQEMEQLKQLISQQAEAMKRFESQSQQYVTQQHDEWTQKQHTQFQKFDGVTRDKDEVVQSLRQELANNKEHHLQELDQALRDAERRAQQSTPVFAGTSAQSYATPVEKQTLTAVAAVAHAEPYQHFTLQDFPRQQAT